MPIETFDAIWNESLSLGFTPEMKAKPEIGGEIDPRLLDIARQLFAERNNAK